MQGPASFAGMLVVGDIEKGYWTSMAPLVIGNHVIVGVGGDLDNITGYIRSIDPDTGKTRMAIRHDSSSRHAEHDDRRHDLGDRGPMILI